MNLRNSGSVCACIYLEIVFVIARSIVGVFRAAVVFSSYPLFFILSLCLASLNWVLCLGTGVETAAVPAGHEPAGGLGGQASCAAGG